MSLSVDDIKDLLVYADFETVKRILRLFPALEHEDNIWNTSLFIQGTISNTPLNYKAYEILTENYGQELIRNNQRVFDGLIRSLLLFQIGTSIPVIWILNTEGEVYSTLGNTIVWIKSNIPERVDRIRSYDTFSIIAIGETGKIYRLGILNQYRIIIRDDITPYRDLYVEDDNIQYISSLEDGILRIKNMPINNNIETAIIEEGTDIFSLSTDWEISGFSLRSPSPINQPNLSIDYPEADAIQTVPMSLYTEPINDVYSLGGDNDRAMFQTETTQDLRSEFEADIYFGEEYYDL